MDAYSGHPHDIQTEAHYHPELNADYLIYVKYANVMYNQLANYQIPIRVHDVTKIGEIAEEAFSRFGLEMPSLFLMTFKGRRLLEPHATVGQIGLRADDVILIQWD